jgi:hypothetical protein
MKIRRKKDRASKVAKNKLSFDFEDDGEDQQDSNEGINNHLRIY